MMTVQRWTKRSLAYVSAATIFVMLGCGDSNPTDHESETLGSRMEPSIELTQAVAKALNNDQVRASVLQGIRGSKVKEGKLAFRSFLKTGQGSSLRQHMGKSDAEISELLASLPELEFYMPVKGHRNSWQGSSDVIVAVLLDEDAQPIGFDVNGDIVSLSKDVPPTRPTLVLVPMERHIPVGTTMSAECNPEIVYCGGGGSGGGGGSTPTGSPGGLYLTYSNIPDMREPWGMGEPELDAMLLNPSSADLNETRIYGCASQGSSGYRFYDQDHSAWYGALDGENDALIADTLELKQARDANPQVSTNGRGMQVVIIEDDSGRCAINDDDDEVVKNLRLSMFYFAASVFLTVGVDDWRNVSSDRLLSIATSATIGAYFLKEALGDDDLIGYAEDAPKWNQRTGDSVLRTHVLIRDGVKTGEANLHVRPVGYYGTGAPR